ncbi:MAG: hypothetical protein Q8M29_11430 [Bacteroidota bacterium]|nr:hypothetical protein [Bacteroidota bacterium]
MKKQFLSKLALAALAVTMCSYSANAQLGNLKNKVKNAANNATGNNNNSSSSSSNTSTSANNSSSGTSGNSATSGVKVDESLSGEQLVDKADGFYKEEKYKEALAHYEAAQNKGDYYVSDGMVRKRMNECRDYLDPAKQKENENAMNQANQTIATMDAAKYKCDNMEPDNGISSPTHTKYLKKIVFSKSEIVKAQENEANFTNTFNVTDNIYSRVFIEKSIKNEAGNVGDCYNGTYFMRWSFDDGSTKLPEWLNTNIHNVLSGNDGYAKWTTWQPGVSPSESDMTFAQTEIKYFVKYIRNLPNGKHKMKMEVVYDIPEDSNNGYSTYEYTTKFGPEKVLASGDFTINITEEGRKQLYKKVCPLYKKTIDHYNSAAFTLVPNATELVKKGTTVDWTKFTLLKIVGDNDWTYKKNVYGIILSRSCGATAYLLNKETNFIHYSSVGYYQENVSSGGAKYGPTTFSLEEQNIEFVRAFDSFCKECIGK